MTSSDSKPLETLLDRALASGAIKKTKAGYHFEEKLVGTSKAKAIAELSANADLLAKVDATFQTVAPLLGKPDVPNDTPPEAPSAGAPEPAGAPDIATESTQSAIETSLATQTKPVLDRAFLKLGLPLPEEIPAQAVMHAMVVVTARLERGRRRAGYGFTREETAIPFADLDAAQLKALGDDPELNVSVWLPKPD